MKKTILLFVAVLMASLTGAQTNNGFNYKALVTDNGTPVANSIISVKVNIRQGSTTRWAETHNNVHTDANGIFSIVIGEGTRTGGVSQFKYVPWGSGNLKLTVLVDTGTGYVTLVNNEVLKYVPYAKSAEKITGVQDKLGVGESPNASETVRFKRDNPNENNDVLDLEFDVAPSTGTAQFIECNLGSQAVFQIHHNGDIYTQGEIHAPDTGNSDMKAYIYGRVNDAGSIINSSGGFSVTKTATGVYKITFNDNTIVDHDYIVVATAWADASPENITYVAHNGFFEIKSWSLSGNPQSTTFDFVVFKK